MAITMQNPRTILLAGKPHILNTEVASEAATPGMLMESHRASAGVRKWRKNSSATNAHQVAVLLNQSEQNLGIDSAVAAGDLVPIALLDAGDVFYGLIPSGQSIANEQLLQSNGDGYLKDATSDAASTNVARFKALDDLGAVTVPTRCRVEVLF